MYLLRIVRDGRMKKWKIVVPSTLIILSLLISYLYNAFEVGVSFSCTVLLVALYYKLRKGPRETHGTLQEESSESTIPPDSTVKESKEKKHSRTR